MQMLFSALQCREGRGRGEKSERVRKAGAVICAEYSEIPTLTVGTPESGCGRASSSWILAKENLLFWLDTLPAGNLWQNLKLEHCLQNKAHNSRDHECKLTSYAQWLGLTRRVTVPKLMDLKSGKVIAHEQQLSFPLLFAWANIHVSTRTQI